MFQERKQEWEWDPGKRKPVYLDVLAYPAPVEHTQRLHQLIQADYSPLIPRASMNEYIRKLESSGERVPLERKEFPANHYWIIIKKWNRWRRLRVIPRIERYVNRHCEFWESEWNLRGGRVSPYTREWIQYENLVDAHQLIYGCEPEEGQRRKWEKQFPAVSIMQRIERGEAARAADIEALERFASPWCKKHATPIRKNLHTGLIKLDMRTELCNCRIPELRDGVAVLYAAVLAQDIQARHQRAMAVVRRWEKKHGQHVSAYFRALGNVKYIHRLREIMPLRRVGDPTLEQKKRIKDAKWASAKRVRFRRASEKGCARQQEV